MPIRSAIAAALLLALAARAEAAEIAITLDDLPYAVPARVSPGQGRDIVERINRTLAAYDVTAMGFAIGEKVAQEALADPIYGMESRYDGPKGLSQIERVTWKP